MKYFCINNVFLFLLISIHLYGSDHKATDTLSVEFLITKASSLFENNPSETEKYAQKALEIAIAQKNLQGEFDAYYQLSRVNFRFGKNIEAIEFAKLAEAGYTRLDDKYSLASLYHTWANGLYIMGDNKTSEIYSDKSIELALESGNNIALGLQYYTRATRAYRNSDIYLAINYLNEALNISGGTDEEMEKLMARCNVTLGQIYANLNDHEKALDYILLAAGIFSKYGMYNTAGNAYANAGFYYISLKKYDLAYAYLHKALDVLEKSEVEYSEAVVYRYFSLYFSALNQEDSAVFYIKKSIELGEKYNQKKSIVLYYEAAMNLFYREKNYDEALRYGRMAMKLSDEQDIPSITRASELILGNIYYNTQKADSAAFYYYRYILGDTLKTLKKIQQNVLKLSELHIKEQTEQKLYEAALKRRILFFSLAGSMAIICMLVFLQRKILKQRNKIAFINAELNEHKEELKQLLEYKSRMLDDREEQYTNLCNNMVNGAVFRAEFEDPADVETGRIAFVSSGWENMSGKPYDREYNYLRHFFQNAYPEDQAMLRSAMSRALKELSVVDVVFRYLKNGETVWFRIRAVVAKNDAGSGQVYVDGYLVDETDQKLFEGRLIAAKEKAEESNRLKTAFLNNISHEVRTPMNAIINFSTLLIGNSLIPVKEKDEYLNLINENSLQLLHIINDMVELSKIETEETGLILKNTVIGEIVHTIEQLVFLKYREKYPQLEFRTDSSAGQTATQPVVVDVNKLIRIIDQLTDNAAKFTQAGYVELGIINENDYFHFYMKDTGIGIPEDQLDNIFDNFIKLDPHNRGTGLGLPIIRQLLAKMSGTIWVESQPGSGSTFHFKIPKTINSSSF